MADKITIARPYARALFSEACDSSTYTDWQDALEAFAAIVTELGAAQLIGNPAISNEQLYTLCIDTIKQLVTVKTDFESELQRFIQLVLQEKRLEIVPEIALLYHQLLAQHNRVVETEVISAATLSEEQKQQLIASLETRFGTKVTATYSEDPSLIGGLIVKSDGWVFDGTIRSKLTRLAERII